ncbi:class I adenylate-forming enzyme family protein [Aliikangiella sp. IMCC44359]|uniref:class I adenylate-forming enzyme family protein n=1 Tax=Aliikangiella sp. IMCC44359 TaxID=3459125 RepID=UPI00403AE748
MWHRIKFVFDKTLTVSNALDKAVDAYGKDFTILKFSGSQKHLGITGNELTFGKLKSVVNQLSNYLVSVGVKRFDRVAICKAAGVDYLILSLAIYRCGAISVPVNGNMSSDNLNKYLEDTGCRFVFVDEFSVSKLDSKMIVNSVISAIKTGKRGIELLGADEGEVTLSSMSENFSAVEIHEHDDVIIVHTSGTTGFPKGVLHGSHSMIRGTKAQLKLQPITRNNYFLAASPANHHITQASIFATLTTGMPTFVPSDENPVQLLKLIEQEKITLMLAFPDIYSEMCAQNLDRYDLSRMKIWMAGGDSSHEAHIKKLTNYGAFLKIFNKKIIGSAYTEFFGTSEVGFAAFMKVSYSSTRQFQRCVGKPTPFSPKIKIADAEGNALPVGTPGRLMVKGPTLFKGYWNAHDKLHGVYIDGWWWTGDIVYKDSSGQYYHMDRGVDVIQTNSHQVFSLPIEEAILKLPNVYEAVVVGKNNGKETTPLIIVEPIVGKSVEEKEVRDAIKNEFSGLPSFEIEVLTASQSLPRGLTGKVLKKQIREDLMKQKETVELNEVEFA